MLILRCMNGPNAVSTGPDVLPQPPPFDVEALVASERWRALQPNRLTESDALPADLGPNVAAIVDAAAGHAAADATEPVMVGDGRLTPMTSGMAERKVPYTYTTADGKRVAVLVLPYTPPDGGGIHEDPNLTLVSDGPTRRVWEYSDLRTYATVPLPDGRSVRFQEHGGTTASDSMPGRIPGLAGIARHRALRRIRAIPGVVGIDESTAPELRHGRHVLRKPGHFMPAVIDIPVVQRVD